jgi:alanyl-tRNA synthetase
VTFPTHALTGTAVVQAVIEVAGKPGVVVDRTPFHPLDNAWPDQPGDTGWLVLADGTEVAVSQTLTATSDPAGVIAVSADIEARRGDDQYEWLVVHVLSADGAVPSVGSKVTLRVDEAVRTPLSLGHTACHLSALAFNAEVVTAGYWRKDGQRLDSLGHPDLDQLSIVSSSIEPYGAVDTYRFGRTIRKAGLEVADLLAGADALAKAVNERLAKWCATGAPVTIEVPDERLTARRRWNVVLPDGTGDIACGGTHVTNLADLGSVTVSYETHPDEPGLVAQTRVERA